MNDQIANTILNQIQRGVVIACGMRGFVATANGLHCMASRGYKVIIELNAFDLYDVTVGRLRGVDWRVVSQHQNVYAEDLNKLLLEVADI